MFVPHSNGSVGFHSDQIHQRYQRRLQQMEEAHQQEIRQIRLRQNSRITEERDTTHPRDTEEAGAVVPGGEIQGMEQTQE